MGAQTNLRILDKKAIIKSQSNKKKNHKIYLAKPRIKYTLICLIEATKTLYLLRNAFLIPNQKKKVLQTMRKITINKKN